MLLDLTSIKAKLCRGREHAQVLHNEIVAWGKRKPYSFTSHVNADNTRYSLILRVNEVAPFQRWSLIFADCLSNFRAALDHLVYTIAVHEHGSVPPPFDLKLMFPITDSRAKFDEAVNQRRLGQISDPVRAVIESAQPYNRPHPPLPPVLSILRDLNNADKHRLNALTYSAVAQGALRLVGEHPIDGRHFQETVTIGELKDGAEVVAAVFDRPTPNMKWDRIDVMLIVAISYSQAHRIGAGYEEAVTVLDLIGDEVRNIVYEFVKT